MPFASKAIRDRQRRRIAQQVRAGQPCALCGQPIDLTLQWPDPDSFVVDHIIPTAHGGNDHHDQLRPAHARCNRIRSDQPDGTVRTNTGALEP